MNRRDFLTTTASAPLASAAVAPAAAAAAVTTLKARALQPGDTVGLITPSTSVSDPDDIESAKRAIDALGLKARFSRNFGKQAGYLGGSIAERVADLHEMFADPSVKAVMCARGGYGSAMLLDRIDFDLVAKHPKIFLGYSDITALHLGIHQTTGLVTFHGPMPLSSLPDYSFDHLRAALFSPQALGVLANPPESVPRRPRHPLRVLRGGKATGPLAGGNLSLVCSTMGTPWEIRTEGKLLFLEDVGEQPYSMDRMLTQLRLAGKFRGIQGLLIGECADCRPRDYKPSFDNTFTLGQVLDNILGDLHVPILAGLTIGHTQDQLTLPLGVTATLDADAGTLTIDEPALM